MRSKEILLGIISTIGLYELSKRAFSDKQRRWIKDRDENKCQAPFNHRCGPKRILHIHHILPQGYGKEMGIENCDFPENGITVCRNAHDRVHPDMVESRREYSQNRGSFGDLRKKRNEQLKHREIYWDDTWDRAMQTVAIRRTQKYVKNKPFPS
jgi:hypothetical protein